VTPGPKEFDHATLQAVVAAAAEEFEGDIVMLVCEAGRVRIGASEGGGLDVRVILSQCLRRLNELEEDPPDATIRAFVRVACENLGNNQVVLIVRERDEVWLASGAGARGKVRDILNDALQSVGGERRRR